MLERAKPLGMALAAVAAVRGIGALETPQGEKGFRLLVDTLLDFFAFARLYERFAATFGPRRLKYQLADLESLQKES